MYPWAVLKIEPTEDRKSIKKAYAIQLKAHRPDDDPEGFQRVNRAYKDALHLVHQDTDAAPSIKSVPTVTEIAEANNQSSPPDEKGAEASIDTVSFSTETDVQTEQSAELISASFEFDETAEIHQPAEQTVVTENNPDQHIIDELFKLTHHMAFSTIHEKLEPSNWAFLSEFNNLQNLMVRDEVAREMFCRVADYNFFQLKENKVLLLPPEVVVYFEAVFDWESRWQEYQQVFEPVYYDHMFRLIHADPSIKTHKTKVSFWNRMIAFSSDAMISLILTSLIVVTLGLESIVVHIFPVVFTLIVLMGQLSRHKQSIGQRLNDIQLYDHYLNKASKTKVFVRNVVFYLMLWPALCISSELDWNIIFELFVTMALVLLNGYALWFKKQWFHEWISQTVLIK